MLWPESTLKCLQRYASSTGGVGVLCDGLELRENEQYLGYLRMVAPVSGGGDL